MAHTLLHQGRGPDVAPRVRDAHGTLASVVCIVCNVALCVAKALVGLAAGSLSVVADAINNLSDASSNIVSLVGFKLASRPRTRGTPTGTGASSTSRA